MDVLSFKTGIWHKNPFFNHIPYYCVGEPSYARKESAPWISDPSCLYPLNEVLAETDKTGLDGYGQ